MLLGATAFGHNRAMLAILRHGYWTALHRDKVIEALVFVQCGRCALCGMAIEQELVKRSRGRGLGMVERLVWRATVDHVWPRSLGGFHGPGNFVAAHGKCNGRKADALPTGCQIVQLVAVNEALGIPTRLKADLAWMPPAITMDATPI